MPSRGSKANARGSGPQAVTHASGFHITTESFASQPPAIITSSQTTTRPSGPHAAPRDNFPVHVVNPREGNATHEAAHVFKINTTLSAISTDNEGLMRRRTLRDISRKNDGRDIAS